MPSRAGEDLPDSASRSSRFTKAESASSVVRASAWRKAAIAPSGSARAMSARPRFVG